ncbi:MAG: 50S ribosomal protein L25/general stress protein Ctc [Candidatus Binatia bacterium]
METVELNAELRSRSGKGPARQMRQQGKVPGIFYGPKRRPAMIVVDAKEFSEKISALEGSHLIRFCSDADDIRSKVALVKAAQLHPVTGAVLHADFYEVDMTEKLRLRVPLHFTGKAVGVALGGILQPIQREVEVECLPGDIPEFIKVDVSGLNIHDTIHVSGLQAPLGVRVCYDTDVTLVTVAPPTVEEVKVEEAAAEAATTEGAAAAEGGKADAEKKG